MRFFPQRRTPASPPATPNAAPKPAGDLLSNHVADMDLLQRAWKMVRSSGGGAGRDEQTIEDFKIQQEKHVGMISDNIAKERYRFTRLRSAAIPKPTGEKRMLGIPTVKDRIVLQAIRLVLETDCEKKMHASCHAYRPGRGAETAMEAMADAMGRGLCFVAETDIRKFFDTVRHATVLDTLRWVAPQYADSRLLHAALVVGPGRWPSKMGLAQGTPLSPLLANVALIDFDRAVVATGVTLIRYAEDLVMLATSRREAERALQAAEKLLKQCHLVLHPGKTRIIDSRSEEFEFLGFRFQPDRISPTADNWNRLHEEIRHWCAKEEDIPWPERIERINGLLRSFAWYYQKADCGRMLWNLDHFVREQLEQLQEQIGKPEQPWQDRLVTAHRLRDARYLGKQKPARRWNGYG